MHNNHLPKILWLWSPVIAILMMMVGENFIYTDYLPWIVGENGPYELIQFFILVVAFGVALYTLVKMDKSNKWMTGWIGLATLCCLYVAGEEISWAQNFLDWNTPEYWAQMNDQNETNFHNTSSWLDQKPRLILSFGIYIGGIIIPLLMKYKSSLLPEKFISIYPTQEFMVTAMVCLFIKVFDKIGEMTDAHLLGRNAESEEMLIFYFVLLYLLLMKKRLIPAKH